MLYVHVLDALIKLIFISSVYKERRGETFIKYKIAFAPDRLFNWGRYDEEAEKQQMSHPPAGG